MKRQTNKGAIVATLGILILVVIISSLVYFAQNKGKFPEPEIEIVDTEVVLSEINMYEVNDSGIDGLTIFTLVADKELKIDVNLNGVPVGIPQPINIHEGSCIETGAVIHALLPSINGVSKTPISEEDSRAILDATSTISINIHSSKDDLSIVSCGDIFDTLMSTSSEDTIEE